MTVEPITDVEIQPGAWVVVAEVFPLGVRAKGISIGASSNWLNNFAVSQLCSIASSLDTDTAIDWSGDAADGAKLEMGNICFLRFDLCLGRGIHMVLCPGDQESYP